MQNLHHITTSCFAFCYPVIFAFMKGWGKNDNFSRHTPQESTLIMKKIHLGFRFIRQGVKKSGPFTESLFPFGRLSTRHINTLHHLSCVCVIWNVFSHIKELYFWKNSSGQWNSIRASLEKVISLHGIKTHQKHVRSCVVIYKAL